MIDKRPIVYRYVNGNNTNNYKHLKNVLNYNIKENSGMLVSFSCENSAVDFTRNRKLNFETTIKNVISMETGSLKDELLKLNDYSVDTPTASAFIQARSKIRVEAFQILFDRSDEKNS